MEIGPFKPLLTILALPPAAPLILALIGLLLSLRARRFGMFLVVLGVVSMWLLSSSAFASWLAQQVMPQYPPQSAATLKAANAQAIVVLGGGVVADAPEYGSPQPNGFTAARLRYGVWLARQSGLPMAYSGGIGWGTSKTTPPPPEGEVIPRILNETYKQPLRWTESKARDTEENARLLAPMLQRDGIQRIALVTSYPHMPRAVLEFRRTGLVVIPAPTGYYRPWDGDWLAWLPTAEGLRQSWYVLRERLGLEVALANGPWPGAWPDAPVGGPDAKATPAPEAASAPAPAPPWREPVQMQKR